MVPGSESKYKGLQKATIPMLSFLALWAGALMYINLRSTEPVLISEINNTIISNIFSPGKSTLTHLNLPDWLLYSLPSGLWAFSYSILITGIWWRNHSRLRNLWLASPLLLAIGWEVLQLLGILSGTFSFSDIFSGATGALIGMFLAINLIKSKNYENKLS